MIFAGPITGTPRILGAYRILNFWRISPVKLLSLRIPARVLRVFWPTCSGLALPCSGVAREPVRAHNRPMGYPSHHPVFEREQHPALAALKMAPIDDEPDTLQERAASEQARREHAAGESTRLEDFARELGIAL